MKKAVVAVIADDFNLTPGTSQGILESAENGIVTGTSVFVNLPFHPKYLRMLQADFSLGIGLHLNITLGSPTSALSDVTSLLGSSGKFSKKTNRALWSRGQFFLEAENQIKRFKKIFGRNPDHLDMHHHLHEDPRIFCMLAQICLLRKIRLRVSSAMNKKWKELFAKNKILILDQLWDDLNPETPWTVTRLRELLCRLRTGNHEIMCHPARCDASLKALSSFNEMRDNERHALQDPALRPILSRINWLGRKDRFISEV